MSLCIQHSKNVLHIVIEDWLQQFEIIEFITQSENYQTFREEWVDSTDIANNDIIDFFDQTSVKLDIESTLATRKI